MKRNLFLFAILLLLTAGIEVQGQKITLESGSLAQIKNEKSLNFEFAFDKMAIGELATEAEYTERKVKEHNDKEPGKGDQWLVEWNDNKTILFGPSLVTAFNKMVKKAGVTGNEGETGAKYTFLVTTTFIEIGFTGWSYANKPSEVNLTITVYEGANRDKEIAVLKLEGAKSTEGDYSYTSGRRIASAYKTAGYGLGKFLMKNAFK
jgi:hypothetical protein